MRGDLPFRSFPRFGLAVSPLPVGLILLSALLLICRVIGAGREETRLLRLETGLQAHGEVSVLLRGAHFAGTAEQGQALATILAINLAELQSVVAQEPKLQAPFGLLSAAITASQMAQPAARGAAARHSLPAATSPPLALNDEALSALTELGRALRQDLRDLRDQGHRNWRLLIAATLLSGGAGFALLLLQRQRFLHGAEQQVAVATAQLRAVYAAAPIGLVLLDDSFRILRTNPSFAAMAHLNGAVPEGVPLRQAMPGLAQVLEPLLGSAQVAGQALVGQEFVIEAARGTLPRHYFVTAEPVVGVEGPPLMSLVVVDVTDRVAAEVWRAEVVAELNHRVKNTLATVQSLAAQTLRGAGDDPHRFAADFSARLGALSRSHELIAADGWSGTTVSQAVNAALAPWLSSGRLALAGPTRVTLRAAQVQALMIALGELAGNAARHGALAGGGGRVLLSWELLPNGLVRPPLRSLPNSSSSASGFLMCSWITRPIGRAPICSS
jgi:PAS domain-containing protein